MTRPQLKNILVPVLALAAATAVSTPAGAQAAASRFSTQVPAATLSGGFGDMIRSVPGFTASSPNAFGLGLGDILFVGNYAQMGRNAIVNGAFAPDGPDEGSASFAFGLGNTSGIALTTTISTNFTYKADRLRQTGISLQASHHVDATLAVAVGVENGLAAGGSNLDGADSWYGVVTKVFNQPMKSSTWLKSVTISTGVGNGRFERIDLDGSNTIDAMVFGSVSAAVHEQVSLFGDFTGADINFGASVVPLKRVPLVFTPIIADITTTASRTARFVMNAGYALHF
ncbi:MAG: hypothetical protein FJ202_07000 [Gemmatimonadetes bacterium]|nr:hypothetical protein [Gemmatimonadota bacterium]